MSRPPSHTELLEQCQSPAAEQRRLAALQWAAARDPAAIEPLGRLLGFDPDETVRAAAAWALDELREPSSMTALIAALGDASFEVRSNAGWALVHLGEPVITGVVEVLRSASDEKAREMARLVLERVPGPAALAALRTASAPN